MTSGGKGPLPYLPEFQGTDASFCPVLTRHSHLSRSQCQKLIAVWFSLIVMKTGNGEIILRFWSSSAACHMNLSYLLLLLFVDLTDPCVLLSWRRERRWSFRHRCMSFPIQSMTKPLQFVMPTWVTWLQLLVLKAINCEVA